ncbi:kinase-like protein [Aspergillus piperis CBS 112811]|uniref:non-specific serine/threonine protein kinase n=1 Tax=Aspergillus piperis CBS 112811 TaxID=1448313 RepID=A0A8G1RDJ8_9EURO|nr:kinase-like protein [Aspergillus piperis CBS 112811]RAH61315.1 kinase-like protein [Aspergillus piperis CBS 112811]
MIHANGASPVPLPQVTTAEMERHVDNITPIRNILSSTPYECSNIEQLSGGHLNLTYRGLLAHPLADGSKSVIIKHSKDYVTFVPGVTCLASRCKVEYGVLEALARGLVAPKHYEGVIVKTPCPYHFFEQNVQIMEDLQGTTPLVDIISAAGCNMSPNLAASLGYAIGSWLGSLHCSTSKRGGGKFDLHENPVGRDTMYRFYLGRLEEKIRTAPHLFDGVADQVRKYAVEEIERRDEDCGMSLVHGDFSVRNLLISDASQDRGYVTVSPIDFESSHYGRRDQDLTQIMGDLYILEIVKGVKMGRTLLQHIIRGYPVLHEEEIFHTACYVGIMIIVWTFAIGIGMTVEQEEQIILFARDLIVRSQERDRAWLETTIVGCLFQESQGV